MLLLSLVTYPTDDSSAFHTSTNIVVANAIGYYGATLAGTTYEETFVVKKEGTYSYFCTNALCGAHDGMFGSFSIGDPSDKPPGYY